MAERDFSDIARLSERFNKDPTSRIFVQLADAYRKNKMIDEALDVLNQGIEHHPNYPLAHLIRGKCLFDTHNYNQAKEAFEKTISLDPQNVVAYRMLAQTCAFLRDDEGLISAYKGILAIDPHDATAKEKLATLASEEQKTPMYTVSIAQEYETQGNLKKALEVYEHLLYTDPSDLLLQQKVKALKGSLEHEEKEPQPAAQETYLLEGITQESDIPPMETETAEPTQDQTPEVMQEPAKEEVISLEELLAEKTAEATPVSEPEPQPAPQPEAEETVSEAPPEAETGVPETPEAVLEEPLTPPPETPVMAPGQEPREAPPMEAIDSEEILKLIETPKTPEPESKPPETTEDVIIERTSEPSLPGTTTEVPEIPQTQEPTQEKIEEPSVEESLPTQEDVSELSPEPTEQQPEVDVESEKPKKPKEEDFQSFKDWLSGLLK